MTDSSPPASPKRGISRPLLIVVAVVAAVWFAFFDSYNLVDRIIWHYEYARLTEENEILRRDIEALEVRLEKRISDEVIEKIAREDYGMRRPGETVYRVAQQP